MIVVEKLIKSRVGIDYNDLVYEAPVCHLLWNPEGRCGDDVDDDVDDNDVYDDDDVNDDDDVRNRF